MAHVSVHQQPVKLSFGGLLLHTLRSERGTFLGSLGIVSMAMRAVIMEDALSGSHCVRLIRIRIRLIAVLRRNLVEPRSIGGNRGEKAQRRKSEQTYQQQ